MSLSVQQLGKVIAEIKVELTGGIIRSIDQPHPGVILFEIEHLGLRYHLLFSGHPHYSRCHLTREKHSTPKIPSPFCQLLRAHLRYKTIQAIKQIPGNQIIELECAWTNNNMRSVTFIAELMRPESNFFLTDAKRCIIGTLSHPQPSRTTTRGIPYYSPLAVVETPDFKGSAIPLIKQGSFPLNRSIDRFYVELEKQDNVAATHKTLLFSFDHSIKCLEDRIKRLAVHLYEAEKSRTYQSYGELLKCHLHKMHAGVNPFRYPEPNSTLKDKKEITLRLDPRLSPTKNMEWFFTEYKNGVLERSTLFKKIEKSKKMLVLLEKGRDAICEGQPVDITDFPLISTQKDRRGNIRKRPFMAYLSSEDILLLVGRNALENERLTFRLAHSNDLWFRACGVPGSHLIVRMAKQEEIPDQTLLEAATLALHFSPYKNAGKGEVMYTRKKHLRRGEKGKRTFVRCAQEQRIYVEIDSSRLANILKNRIDHEHRHSI